MGNDKKNIIPFWARTGHQAPVTRRELLAAGLIPFAASLLVPKWTKLLLPSAAEAAASCAVPSSGMIPLITLNLSGGAAMAGNFVPMDKAGQLLPNYDLVGLGDNQVPIAREFGNVPFAGVNPANGVLISKMLQGIREMGPDSLGRTAFVGVPVRSRDDSSENKFSIDGLTSKAGLVGSDLPNLGTNSNSATGVSQKAAVLKTPAPLTVSGLNSITGSLGYAGAIGGSLNNSQKLSLAKLINNLSQSQTAKLQALKNSTDVNSVLECAGIKSIDLVNKTPAVDPRLDAAIGTQLSTLWGITANTGNSDRNLIFSSVVYNVLKGNSGSGALQLGGYDYHDNTRTTGDTKDLDAGRSIGRILQMAHLMNKPIFIYVTSDGAVSSAQTNARDSVWKSDRGSASVAYMLYFNPTGRAPTKNFQIGQFTSGQVADDTFITGGNPEVAATAVFANYLQLNNQMNLFSTIVPSNIFSVANLNQVLMFG